MLKIDSSKKAHARKQAGFVVTVELLLITTILGLGLITGFVKVRDQVISELNDSGAAIGAINQSYQVVGTQWITAGGDNPATVSGFAFNDSIDPNQPGDVGGDTTVVTYNPAVVVPATVHQDAQEIGIQ